MQQDSSFQCTRFFQSFSKQHQFLLIDHHSFTSRSPSSPRSSSSSMILAPKVSLQEKRWFVENFHCNPNIQLAEVEISHSVFINKCTESTISISHKSKAVTVNGCAKTNVIVDDIVTKFELIHCKSCAIQVNGTCGTIDLNNCEDVQIYLASEAALACEIFTSQCRNVNVLVLDESGAEREFQEHSIPCLYQSRYSREKKKLETVPFRGCGE